MPDARPTPGPWRVVKDDFGEIVVEGPDGIGIADLHGKVAAPEKAWANARLIAAAVNAVHRLAEHLGRSPLEVAGGWIWWRLTTWRAHYARTPGTRRGTPHSGRRTTG